MRLQRKPMKFAFLTTIALSLCLAVHPVIAKGKVWTVEARQAQLMQDINEGQKGKQLTKKESDRCRSDLADVSRRKKKMKTKNKGAALTEDQKKELEGDLNSIRDLIHKYKLEKRAK